jgi:hypothetical protein
MQADVIILGKAVTEHIYGSEGGGGGITPTHLRPRH